MSFRKYFKHLLFIRCSGHLEQWARPGIRVLRECTVYPRNSLGTWIPVGGLFTPPSASRKPKKMLACFTLPTLGIWRFLIHTKLFTTWCLWCLHRGGSLSGWFFSIFQVSASVRSSGKPSFTQPLQFPFKTHCSFPPWHFTRLRLIYLLIVYLLSEAISVLFSLTDACHTYHMTAHRQGLSKYWLN